MAFCEKCGNQVIVGAAFCPKCGARTGSSAQANPTTPSPRVVTPAAVLVTPVWGTVPASNDSGGCGKALLIVGIVVLLCAALGIAGVVYVGYRAKKKVDEIKREITGDDRKATSDQSARRKEMPRRNPQGPQKKIPRRKKAQRDRGSSIKFSATANLYRCTSTTFPKVLWSGTAPLVHVPNIRAQFLLRGRPTKSILQEFR